MLTAEFFLDTDAENNKRAGRLTLRKLLHWSLEPSADGIPLEGPLWLTADGLLQSAKEERALAINAALPTDCFAWYLFFNDLNTFAYCASEEAVFEWL